MAMTPNWLIGAPGKGIVADALEGLSVGGRGKSK
jgi:hypothetical protein